MHGRCQELWTEFRVQYRNKGEKMKLLVALDGVRELTEVAFHNDIVVSSWKRCGFQAGMKVDKQKTLRDRFDELFGSTPARETLKLQSPASEFIPRPANFARALGHPCQLCRSWGLDPAVVGFAYQQVSRAFAARSARGF